MSRPDGATALSDRRSEVARDALHVGLPAQPAGERPDRLVRVIPGAVEAAVDGTLDTAPDGLEQPENDERGDRDRDRPAVTMIPRDDGEQASSSRTTPMNTTQASP